ncbi:MAG: HTTM domain-containing protein [Leptospiraceae bacterium]|nr:HTTM domain-containing protein [Leptospiraceae bacterium]
MTANRASDYLWSTVDARPFLLFRALWGLILFFLPLRYFLHGWIQEYFYRPQFFFSFIDTSWYGPLPWPGMYVVFGFLCLLGLSVAIGYRYRIASLLYALLFFYFHSLDKTIYLNHYYLVFLLTGLLAFLPPPQRLRGPTSMESGAEVAHFDKMLIAGPTGLESMVIPRLALISIQVLIAIVYFYAALAKMRSDWLFDAMPLRIWLPARVDSLPAGHWLSIPAVAWFFAWGGLLFDGLIPFFLFWKRSAKIAFAAVILFHVTTALLFRIGMFPWIMIAANTIFLGPLLALPDGFYGKVLGRFVGVRGEEDDFTVAEKKAVREPPATFHTLRRNWPWSKRKDIRSSAFGRGFLLAFLLGFFIFQIVAPARRFFYPGKTTWNEYGFRFSWQVMVMQKSGLCEFTILQGDRQLTLDPSEILTPYQELMMSTQPDMILQFGQYLSRRFGAGQSSGAAPVFARCLVSLNGRPHQSLIRSDLDLSDPNTKVEDIIVPFLQATK